MATSKRINKDKTYKDTVLDAVKRLAGLELWENGNKKDANTVAKFVKNATTSMHVVFTHKGETFELWGVTSFEYDIKRDTAIILFDDDSFCDGMAFVHGSFHVTECWASNLGAIHNVRNDKLIKVLKGE